MPMVAGRCCRTRMKAGCLATSKAVAPNKTFFALCPGTRATYDAPGPSNQSRPTLDLQPAKVRGRPVFLPVTERQPPAIFKKTRSGNDVRPGVHPFFPAEITVGLRAGELGFAGLRRRPGGSTSTGPSGAYSHRFELTFSPPHSRVAVAATESPAPGHRGLRLPGKSFTACRKQLGPEVWVPQKDEGTAIFVVGSH